MNTSDITDGAQGEFDVLLAAYIDSIDAGDTPSRDDLLERYPQYQEQWTEFFRLQDHTESLIAAWRDSGPDATDGARAWQLPDFELLHVVGRGGMGTVYKARQRSLDRLVAVKVMRSSGPADKKSRERFRQEAIAAARLSHPNIVRVYEVGEIEEHDYLVMDLVDGKTLADVAGDAPVSDRQAAGWLASMARAIEHAHEKGVLHRDLKPSNVLLDEKGDIHVSDFGLAKRLDAADTLTHSGEVLGTPAYMSPEQARGQRPDLESTADVYSLGAILYELLTGRPPFTGQSPYEVIRQVIQTEPVRPRLLNPDVSADLETICLKCLEKEPKRRYASVRELREDVDRFLDDRPILARPISRQARLARWTRRNPIAAGLSSVIGLLLVVAIVVPLVYSLRLSAAIRELERSNTDLDRSRREAIRQRDRAGLHAYVVETRQALQAWEDSDFEESLRLLRRHEPRPEHRDHRGWEWYFVRGLCETDHLLLRGHDGMEFACAWHPDGTRIASAGSDGTVRIWNVEDRRRLRSLGQGPHAATSVGFSPDGTLLAAGSQDGSIRIWDADDGVVVRTMSSSSRSDDGEARKGKPGDAVDALAWSPEGNRLASGHRDGRIAVWNPLSGEKQQDLVGHKGRVGGLAWSPSGKRLASCAWDAAGQIWDPVAGNAVLQVPGLKSLGMAQDVAWSPAEDKIAFATWGGPVAIADAETGRIILSLSGPGRNSVQSVAWHPDGRLLASIGYDRHVRVWDTDTGVELYTLRGHADWGYCVRFSPDGKRLATAAKDGTVRVWPLESQLGPMKAFCGSVVYTVAVSPDGTSLAANINSKDILILTGDDRRQWSGHEGAVYEVAWRSDGKRLASASSDGTVRIWDFDSGRTLHVLEGHEATVFSIAWSPDGKRLASIDSDGDASIWNAETGARLARIDAPHADHRGGAQVVPPISSVGWSPDGRRLALCRGGAASVWDADSKELLFRLTDPESATSRIVWSPDGGRVAASGLDGRIHVWDVATRHLEQTLYGHANRVEALAWHPGGKRLASGSWDKSIRVWNLETGNAALTLRGHTSWVTSVSWHPDGRRLFSAGWDAAVRVWDAQPGYDAATGE